MNTTTRIIRVPTRPEIRRDGETHAEAIERFAAQVRRAAKDVELHLDPTAWDTPWRAPEVSYCDSATVYTFTRNLSEVVA